jgi:hypothetical protein
MRAAFSVGMCDLGPDDGVPSIRRGICTSLGSISLFAVSLERTAGWHACSNRDRSSVVGAHCVALSWQPAPAVEFIARAGTRIGTGCAERAFRDACCHQYYPHHRGDNHDLGSADTCGHPRGSRMHKECHGPQHDYLSRAWLGILPALLLFRRHLPRIYGGGRHGACGSALGKSVAAEAANDLCCRYLGVDILHDLGPPERWEPLETASGGRCILR